jgi:uncharacterized protein involved in response to NO
MPQLHPYEMLLGFALAAVAGNQLGAASEARVALLFGLWIAGRGVTLAWPTSTASLVANALFSLALAAAVAPRLAGAAKKMRNRALPVVLVALCAAAAAVLVQATVLLLATLMLFMGGRILAPAIAGQLQRQGVHLGPRVQPRIEGALLVAMALALAWPPLCIAAGMLTAVRLVRWRAWALRGRRDLLCLAAGYAWLALGLGAFGVAALAGGYEAAALHLITVGALGTLTFNVMAMSWLLKAHRDPSRQVLVPLGTALIAAATVARVTGFLDAAALCWTAAFLVLLLLFVLTKKRGQDPFLA